MARIGNNFLVVCAGFLLSGAALARGQVTSTRYEGSMGTERIGMTLVTRGHDVLDGSRYYLQSDLKDVPLSGLIGRGMKLETPDGDTLSLSFTGPRHDGHAPASMDESTGLQGWRHSADGGRYAVKLSLVFSRQTAEAPARWYELVTNKSDAAFETKIQGFYRAVLAHDIDNAAKNIGFPLRVNTNKGSVQIRNVAELRKRWDSVFTASWLKDAASTIPHDLPVLKNMAMLGDGLAYFSDAGAVVINAR